MNGNKRPTVVRFPRSTANVVVQASRLPSPRGVLEAAASRPAAGGTPAPQAAPQPSPGVDFTDPRTTPFVEPKWRGCLPHLYKEGGSYFVTFRLWDAVTPANEREVKAGGMDGTEGRAGAGGTPAPQKRGRQKTREEVAAESEPPLRLGSCMLARKMPNHVHVVYTAMGEHTPQDIHHSWKSYTAHKINKLLGRTSAFWESERFDHLVRSVEDLEFFIAYTENNPVAAGLCALKEAWAFSSAGAG